MIIVIMSNIHARGQCTVKMKSIQGTYDGQCKKGLADGFGKALGTDTYEGYFKKGWPDGKGKYSWKNGNYYEGEWKKGEMNGEGKMVLLNDDQQEEITSGFWKQGEYIGLYKETHKVFNKTSNITNVDFSLLNNTANEIRIVLFSGKQLEIDRITVTPTIGLYENLQQTGNSVILTNVEFPFRAYVNMPQYNFDFVINQSGNWEVRIEVDLEFQY
jgi:hypothetical protein